MLAVAAERGGLDAGRFPTRQPQPAGFADRDAAAVGGVGASTNIDSDLGMMGVGIPLAFEGLEVSIAVLVAVIDDPALALFAAIGCPTALAHRHA